MAPAAGIIVSETMGGVAYVVMHLRHDDLAVSPFTYAAIYLMVDRARMNGYLQYPGKTNVQIIDMSQGIVVHCKDKSVWYKHPSQPTYNGVGYKNWDGWEPNFDFIKKCKRL